MNARIPSALDELFGIYEKRGTEDYIGEAISQIEHAAQSAEFAEKNGEEEAVILAAFFHDIGHLCGDDGTQNEMNGYGKMSHEKIGANYLRKLGFSETIARLVENHVQAKRYLCVVKPEYYPKLSEASKKTLQFQGGVMTQEEASAFERDPLFQLSIKMRAWDEAAKEENKPLPDLLVFRTMAERCLSR
ncbi:MAG: HD domain-containing protein [Chitinophagales bacterium]|nr:HD domain-containing protein [Chitinophagales bacterium]